MQQFNLKNLEPRIVTVPETKLVAQCVSMSFSLDKTHELWKKFGPMIKKIPNRIGNDRYSVQIYPNVDFFEKFNPEENFKKYAAVNVSDYGELSDELEQLIIPQGLYAIFDYIGKPSEAADTYRYIFYQWIPNSQYSLDDRPHIAIMGENYKGEELGSEEEFLIPIAL